MSDEQLNKILDKLLEEYSNLTTNVRKDVESLRSMFIEIKVIVENHTDAIKSLKNQKSDTTQWMQNLILILLTMLSALIGIKVFKGAI